MRYYIRIEILLSQTPFGTPSCFPDFVWNKSTLARCTVNQITRPVYQRLEKLIWNYQPGYHHKGFGIYIKLVWKSNAIEKWMVKFVQICNWLLPAPHFPSTIKHFGKIRLHVAFTLFKEMSNLFYTCWFHKYQNSQLALRLKFPLKNYSMT